MAEVLDWQQLDGFKKQGNFASNYPADFRTFFAPYDDVHGVLKYLFESAKMSVVVNMFGFDDDELADMIRTHLDNDDLYVQLSLDRSQSKGKHESEILSKFKAEYFGNSIAIGTSIKHAISHLKCGVIDGIYSFTGSTNWSTSGETKQDNELTISRDPVKAIELRHLMDLSHDHMLQAMKSNTNQVH